MFNSLEMDQMCTVSPSFVYRSPHSVKETREKLKREGKIDSIRLREQTPTCAHVGFKKEKRKRRQY